MVKPRTVILTLAVVFLLAPTLGLGYHVFFAPPSYMSTLKMTVSGKLSPDPLPPQPRGPSIDRDDIYAIIALLVIYAPGIALLCFAIFYRGRPKPVAPPII